MGVIENGTVSGELPSNEAFAVHYPGYPSSTSRAVDSLGGAQALLKARTSPSNKLELRFLPDDPYSHPAFGELRPCINNFLLKISKTQSVERNSDAELAADIVARVPQAYHFEDNLIPEVSVVTLSPEVLVFGKKNEKQLYNITIGYRANEKREVSFGALVWVEENGKHEVRSPIVVSPMLNF